MNPEPSTPATVTVDIRNNGLGGIFVHKAGCADLRKRAYQGCPAAWTEQVTSLQDVVTSVYPPDDFEYDLCDWRSFAADIELFPCLRELPETTPATAPATA